MKCLLQGGGGEVKESLSSHQGFLIIVCVPMVAKEQSKAHHSSLNFSERVSIMKPTISESILAYNTYNVDVHDTFCSHWFVFFTSPTLVWRSLHGCPPELHLISLSLSQISVTFLSPLFSFLTTGFVFLNSHHIWLRTHFRKAYNGLQSDVTLVIISLPGASGWSVLSNSRCSTTVRT